MIQKHIWQSKLHFQDCGEILFGLSYLPTAQRLSFSMIKINNIKHDKNKEEEPLSKSNQSSETINNTIPRRPISENIDVQPVWPAGQEEEDNSEG